MSKVVAIAGLGDEATPAPSGSTMLAWCAVLGLTAGIFIGTLMLGPAPARRKKRGA